VVLSQIELRRIFITLVKTTKLAGFLRIHHGLQRFQVSDLPAGMLIGDVLPICADTVPLYFSPP
jgi:hypothetical protein